jgi:hypothetical protein
MMSSMKNEAALVVGSEVVIRPSRFGWDSDSGAATIVRVSDDGTEALLELPNGREIWFHKNRIEQEIR